MKPSLWRHLLFGPVWLLTLSLRPWLRSGHPWKARAMTLESWARFGTPIAAEFSAVFWISLFACAVINRIIFRR